MGQVTRATLATSEEIQPKFTIERFVTTGSYRIVYTGGQASSSSSVSPPPPPPSSKSLPFLHAKLSLQHIQGLVMRAVKMQATGDPETSFQEVCTEGSIPGFDFYTLH